MDGTEHTMLVQWIGTYESYGVSHMTIDKTTNRLYWVGWHEAYIEYIDLSKSTPMVRSTPQPNTGSPLEMKLNKKSYI